jgi:hypothetical protein
MKRHLTTTSLPAPPGLYRLFLFLSCLIFLGSADAWAQNPSVVGAEVVSEVFNGTNLDVSISTIQINLPNGSLNNATLNSSTVKLFEDASNTEITSTIVNGTGGGDAIVLTASGLAFGTVYRWEIGAGVEDITSASMTPFSTTFTTTSSAGNTSSAQFQQVSVASGAKYTCVAIGPDGKLYGLVNNGLIHRWDINLDGTLANQQILNSLQTAEGGNRLAIHLAFDPASTAANLIAWVSHSTFGFGGMADWGGKITRLSGSDLQTVQDYVINLPRSTKDHVTNGITFGPDGALYALQGSNTAMGDPDNTWGNRPERLLTAAVLRIDLSAIATPPLDAQTEAGGTYDPWAVNAPLTLFATGVRNPYDLVWHSNGELYIPTNGSAAGGNTPATPANLANVPTRIDGAYVGGAISAISPVNQTQNDFLFRAVQGGYYGHPNPTRGEYVMNGGNPTAGSDPGQVNQYSVGTLPDQNWRGFAYNFQNNKSPNGVIEYTSPTFAGELQGKLLVVRYSGGDDIIVLTPGGINNDIIAAETGIAGFTGFSDPLDLVENPANGHIYVAEYGGNEITLLRPIGSGVPDIDLVTNTPIQFNGDELIFSCTKNSTDQQTFDIVNNGGTDLNISALSFSGTNATEFSLISPPGLPLVIASGNSVTLTVEYDPAGVVGQMDASLDITSDDPDEGSLALPLFALSANGLEGNNEPPLNDVVNTLGVGVNVGWTSLGNTTSATLQGEEVDEPLFEKAGTGDVEMIALARYSPLEPLPFGYYTPNGTTPTLNLVATMSGVSPQHQVLYPDLASGTMSFDPGSGTFGFYTSSSSHEAYTEDALNAALHPSQVAHAARVYPAKDRQGNLVADTYLFGFEEASNGDYNDYVFLISNVQPVNTSPPPPPVGNILYRETFWNDDPNNNAPLSDAAWFGFNAGGNPFANFILSNSIGKPVGLSNVNAGPDDPSPAKDVGLLAAFNGGNTFFGYTEEFSINLATTNISNFSWYQGHSSGSASMRVAVRIGGQWYATSSTYTNSALGSASNFQNADPGGAEEKIFTFSQTASEWQILNFTQGTTLSLGSVLSSDLPTGIIDAFGFYADNGGNFTFRADNLTIEGGSGSGGNNAPVVANPIPDQSATVGVLFSFQVPANTFDDPDPGDVLTYAATLAGGLPLPAWLSFDPQTQTFSGTPAAGDVGQYDLEVTASDAEPLSATDAFLLDVQLPSVDCNPISTLACSAVAVDISQDFCLDFTGTEGGLSDNLGSDIGFTMALEPSAPLAADLPLDPTAPGYKAANLSIGSSALTITATKGILFKEPGASNNTNSQINGLGVGFDANQANPYSITTTMSNIPAASGSSFQQAGLWFGLDESDYLKLVIMHTGSSAYKVQFYYEFNEAAVSELNTGNGIIASGTAVILKMDLDPTTNTITGSYSTDGGNTFNPVGSGSITVDASLFTGVSLSGVSGNVSYAGVHASIRNSSTPLDYQFDEFCIDVPQVTGDLNGTLTLQGRTDHSSPLTVELFASGQTTTPAYTFTPSSDASGNFSVSGIAPGTYEVAVKADYYLQTVETITIATGANAGGFGEQLAGDANDDNLVSLLDFSLLAAAFNSLAPNAPYDIRADFNGDGLVNALDFSLLATNYLQPGETP